MMQKVVSATIKSSLTGFEDRWDLKLECGHSTWDVRKPTRAMHPKTPKRRDCRECDQAAAAKQKESKDDRLVKQWVSAKWTRIIGDLEMKQENKPSLLEVAMLMQEMISELDGHEGAEGWSQGMGERIHYLQTVDLRAIAEATPAVDLGASIERNRILAIVQKEFDDAVSEVQRNLYLYAAPVLKRIMEEIKKVEAKPATLR